MQFLFKLSVYIFFNTYFCNSNGYKILGVFTVTSRSHDIFCQSLMILLANRGHKVDVISTTELENPPENYSTILNIGDILPFKATEVTMEQLFSVHSSDVLKFMTQYYGNEVCEILANKNMQEILRNLKKTHDYDLLIIESFLANCFMGIAHFLNIPMITVSPQILYPWVDDEIGNPVVTAIHPNILSPLTEVNSFWDRLQNTVQYRYIIYKFHYFTDKIQTEIMRKYLSPDVPNVRELPKTSLLTLMNSHFSFNGIRPLTPALIEIGGLHIFRDKTKLLPGVLQKWMDESKHGVVYFTFGSIIAIESLPKKTILTFFASFEKLKPIRFLIRIKNMTNIPTHVPENVKMMPWIPQVSVLEHKNTRAFISHCGLLSSQEAVHFGVPVIGFPLVLDQVLNLHYLKKLNMAIQLNIQTVSQTDLVNALTTIVNNSSYSEAAKRASDLFKDRPMNAEDTAVFWIEYVIRNGGILKSPAVNLHWIQRELLDVYGFLIISIVLILYSMLKFVNLILNLKRKTKSKNSKEKVN